MRQKTQNRSINIWKYSPSDGWLERHHQQYTQCPLWFFMSSIGIRAGYNFCGDSEKKQNRIWKYSALLDGWLELYNCQLLLQTDWQTQMDMKYVAYFIWRSGSKVGHKTAVVRDWWSTPLPPRAPRRCSGWGKRVFITSATRVARIFHPSYSVIAAWGTKLEVQHAIAHCL